MKKNKNMEQETQKKSSVFGLLGPYKKPILFLSLVSIGASVLGLIIPKIISRAIDGYITHTLVMQTVVIELGLIGLGIFILTYLQSIVQTVTAERVARDLRNTVVEKISKQSYEFVEEITPSKLLTNITSDIDSIKMLIGQAIAAIISSIVVVIGAAVFLITIDWKLALAVLAIIPLIGIIFAVIFSRVRELMKKGREVIDRLNRVINESVLGAALIRVLNSQKPEFNKFVAANSQAKGIGLKILGMFAAMIPAITFVANLAMLTVLALGGHFVIVGSMTLGDFAAFNSYIGLLIFPIIIMGVMGSMISQAQASYDRVREILDAKDKHHSGNIAKDIHGNIEFKNVNVKYGEKFALKDINFVIPAKSKTAIIGPTAAGKTQILNLLTNLIPPTDGTVLIDNEQIGNYESTKLHRQIGFVFQDSIIFNLSVRDNIAFGGNVSDIDLQKAIDASELGDFITTLPDGLNTIISERGSSLSGGQKQRIMLARALALNPKILLLDDFTARVDNKTEEKIIANVNREYPEITLVSVTQKISSAQNYDQIIVLMEGEVIAIGTHEKLLETSPEYAQIYDSQKSTSHYE